MPTQKKIELVEEIKALIERASITVSADFRGLRVQEMDQMRRRLRQAKVEVRVVKNNLLRLAADQSGMPELMQIVEGPTALVLGYDDPTEAAKAVTEYAQSAPPTFAIQGAFLDGQVVSAADLKTLVSLPPKPVLLAQLAGQLQSPLATLAGLLESQLRDLSALLRSALSELPGLIEARAAQLEASGEQADAPSEPQASAAVEAEGEEAPTVEAEAEGAPAEPGPAAEEVETGEAEEEPAAEEQAVEETPAEQAVEETPAEQAEEEPSPAETEEEPQQETEENSEPEQKEE